MLLPRNSGDYLVLKRTVLLMNYYLGQKVGNRPGPPLLLSGLRGPLVINFTAPELVSNWSQCFD